MEIQLTSFVKQLEFHALANYGYRYTQRAYGAINSNAVMEGTGAAGNRPFIKTELNTLAFFVL